MHQAVSRLTSLTLTLHQGVQDMQVLRRSTLEIRCSNGCSMSCCPSSVVNRWFRPTGSKGMLLRKDMGKNTLIVKKVGWGGQNHSGWRR